MAPVIFIVPGLWEGPEVFEPLKKALENAGLSVFSSRLVSTGTTAASGLTVKDDTAAIARDLAATVELAGSDGVVVFLHSAGGFLCSAAMQGLTANSMSVTGRKGGVRGIIFMSCAFGPEGFETKPTSTMQYFNNSYFTCIDPRGILFNDMVDSEAMKWIAKLQCQPANWDGTTNYCGWREVPSVYIILKKDKGIPPEVQEQMAILAGSKVVHLDAGHMAQLTKMTDVAQIILSVTAEFQ
ncbi:uncharacterized protein N7482_010809 [Penicillium canariense]|uniref:AB hydrolase-1 domain-containing protein n=1 Tax=Penicillium canariense TaxID=189055 RepID=A0A9W9HMA7_9EURO|nr:uncharacterized protein N7482_010809 [Penicillium canariense]KAJ5150351.1 hypothetical protein N7482_010809 [Penicillium canariense]